MQQIEYKCTELCKKKYNNEKIKMKRFLSRGPMNTQLSI